MTYPNGSETFKRMLTTLPDVNLALLSYRAVPLPLCALIPAEFLMSRVIRMNVPQHVNKYEPEWSYLPMYREKQKRYRENQKRYFDRHHRTRTLLELTNNT